jgi:hypothetical protein
VELEKLHAHVDKVEDEHVAEAEKLSTLVVGISNAPVDLGMLLIRDIPQLPKLVHEVLTVVGLILERLQEEHASDTGPWD